MFGSVCNWFDPRDTPPRRTHIKFSGDSSAFDASKINAHKLAYSCFAGPGPSAGEAASAAGCGMRCAVCGVQYPGVVTRYPQHAAPHARARIHTHCTRDTHAHNYRAPIAAWPVSLLRPKTSKIVDTTVSSTAWSSMSDSSARPVRGVDPSSRDAMKVSATRQRANYTVALPAACQLHRGRSSPGNRGGSASKVRGR